MKEYMKNCLLLITFLCCISLWSNYNFAATVMSGDIPTNEIGGIHETFRTALLSSDWNKVLSLCSDRVQETAKKQKSLEEFFRSVIPVNGVKSNMYFSKTGITQSSTSAPPEDRPLSQIRYSAKINVYSQNSNIMLTWNADIVKSGNEWRFDFKPISIKKQIEDLLTMP